MVEDFFLFVIALRLLFCYTRENKRIKEDSAMNRKLEGIALMLLSLILIIGFNSVGWTYCFDFDFCWQHIWMLLGLVGFVMVFWDGPKK